jgi:tRNA pseudouridine65 synthase
VQILYQDDALIAVNKPSGLLTHRSWVDADAREFALQQVRALTGRRLFPVHRLDRPTSGLLLHACSMRLRHPLTGAPLQLTAPIDDPAMLRALDRLRFGPEHLGP